ncbi:MAG TPA: calcium-binding protein [Baekduia sp.]|nr:calcium-binding protein [Baekduia sp.]
MHRITRRTKVAAALSAAAALAVAAPAAHAAPTVQANAQDITIATQSSSEAGITVTAAQAELTATRVRLRLDRAPIVAGGCTVVTISPAVVDCPRRSLIRVTGTSNRDVIDLALGSSTRIQASVHTVGGDDLIKGTGSADTLIGGGGNDEIRARFGNDDVRGHNGDDELLGGPGDDRVEGGNNADVISGGNGRDKLWARTPQLPHTDDEIFNNDRFLAEDGQRDEIFCDSTPAFGVTPGTFDAIDENVNDVCRLP